MQYTSNTTRSQTTDVIKGDIDIVVQVIVVTLKVVMKFPSHLA